MDSYKSALERAFELAETGNYKSVEEIRRRLSQEGYFTHQILGRTLSQQINKIIRANRPSVTDVGTLSSFGR